ncbi:Uncharacterised protein [Chlamydia abortus]|nr:Uncharacterised protein [Chlamydia abortus]
MHRIMRLQVGRLIGQHPVSRGMRPGKAVIGKTDDHIIDPVGFLLGASLLHAARYEESTLFVQHLALLLADGSPQQVRLSETEAGHRSRDLHDLLLVYDDPVSIFKYWHERFMRIFHFDQSVLGLNIFRNKIHRPRTVQSIHRNDVLKFRWLQFLQHPAHPGGFQLEYPCRIPSAKKPVSIRIVV